MTEHDDLPGTAEEPAHALQTALRTLRADVDRLADLAPAERIQAGEQLVTDAAALDANLAEAGSLEPTGPADADNA